MSSTNVSTQTHLRYSALFTVSRRFRQFASYFLAVWYTTVLSRKQTNKALSVTFILERCLWCKNICCFISSVTEFVNLHIISPWYNRTGWLGVKHQVIYLLTAYYFPRVGSMTALTKQQKNNPLSMSFICWRDGCLWFKNISRSFSFRFLIFVSHPSSLRQSWVRESRTSRIDVSFFRRSI